jgi:hypothetical protein
LTFSFGGFSPWLIGPVAFEPVQRLYIMTGVPGGINIFTSCPGCKRERKRASSYNTFLGHSPKLKPYTSSHILIISTISQ